MLDKLSGVFVLIHIELMDFSSKRTFSLIEDLLLKIRHPDQVQVPTNFANVFP
jgi:hypothetical protein